MRLKIHIIFVTLLLILGLSFPATVQAKGKKIPHGVPFKLLLKKIYALTERVETLENLVNILSTNNSALNTRLACIAEDSGEDDFFFEGCNVHVVASNRA